MTPQSTVTLLTVYRVLRLSSRAMLIFYMDATTYDFFVTFKLLNGKLVTTNCGNIAYLAVCNNARKQQMIITVEGPYTMVKLMIRNDDDDA